MKCPFCNSQEMVVTNSRETFSGYATWRRRKCIHCLNTFTTYESVNLDYIIVKKRNSSKQRYSHEKLFSSILSSFLKQKNADTGDCATNAKICTEEVEKIIIAKNLKEISTQELFDITVCILVQKNMGAAMNYISYFLKNDKEKKELQEILQNYIARCSHITEENK